MRLIASCMVWAIWRRSPMTRISSMPSRASAAAGGFFRSRRRRASRSSCRMRPSRPLPTTVARSMPRAEARARTAGAAAGFAAARRCAGGTAASVGGAGSGELFGRATGAGCGAAALATIEDCSGARSGVAMATSSAPTAAMSPVSPLRRRILPLTGDPISTVAFSVMTSTSGWSSLISSPTSACQAMISASATPSPTSGSLKT